MGWPAILAMLGLAPLAGAGSNILESYIVEPRRAALQLKMAKFMQENERQAYGLLSDRQAAQSRKMWERMDTMRQQDRADRLQDRADRLREMALQRQAQSEDLAKGLASQERMGLMSAVSNIQPSNFMPGMGLIDMWRNRGGRAG